MSSGERPGMEESRIDEEKEEEEEEQKSLWIESKQRIALSMASRARE